MQLVGAVALTGPPPVGTWLDHDVIHVGAVTGPYPAVASSSAATRLGVLAGFAADAVLAAAVEVVGVWGEYLEAAVGDVAAVEVRRWRWDAHRGV
jgi:hypothetical protein